MKLTLSRYDVWRLANGIGMMVEEQKKEEGVTPGLEDENMILINALLSLASVLYNEGGFVVMETIPFPLNIKTEQQGDGYELPSQSKVLPGDPIRGKGKPTQKNRRFSHPHRSGRNGAG